ncbi:hypothetical protein EP331_10695 [bacterium]|nr:MAG: hypothetical protein EP331_10695 [bacterium]
MTKPFFIGFILFFLGLQGSLTAQTRKENTSIFQRYSADISYGLPFYVGDFYRLFSDPLPYDGSLLGGISQYNNSTVSGSLIIPWKYNISFRLKATQTVIFYTEALANVNFKNTLYDFSLLPQYNFNLKKFNIYVFAGVGYHVSTEATIFQTISDTEIGNNYGQIVRMSTTGGFGVEYNVWRQFSLFIEGEWYFTGSDRFDGYNGFQAGQLEKPQEKDYFTRDQIISGRSGIRVYFMNSSKLVAERSFSKKSSSYYKDPYTKLTPEEIKKEKEEELPEELKKLGVKRKLTGYSLEVNRVFTVDELKRQKSSGEKVITSIHQAYPNAQVQLLLEANGFTIHIGGFGSLKEAKNAMYTVRQYYNAANVRKH